LTGKWKYLIGALLVVLLICGGTASYIVLARSGRAPSREPDQEIEFVETKGFFADPTGREPGASIDEQGARELFILCRSAVLPELPPPSKEYIDSTTVEKVLDVVDNCTQMRVSGPDFFMGVQTQDCCIFNMQYLGPYDDPNAKFVPISEKEAREKGERLMDTLQGLEVLFAARYHLDREEAQYSIEHVDHSSPTGVDA